MRTKGTAMKRDLLAKAISMFGCALPERLNVQIKE
jgi:hypothetical protein